VSDLVKKPGAPRGVKIDAGLVRALRRERGWSQIDLALLAQLAQRTVKAAEGGHTVGLRSVRALATALGVPITRLCAAIAVASPAAARDDKPAHSLPLQCTLPARADR
jgi:transcriptional regulator with XRE-family HTH domain